MTRPSLKSRFGEQIRAFVGYKNSLGFPYNESIRILGRFDDFCVERFPEKDCLDCELALAWLEKRDTENTAGHRNRIMVIREFAKYLRAVGTEAYMIPISMTSKGPRYVPHIFNEAEIKAFFHGADSFRPHGKAPARHLVIPVFYRLLYCCGLRPAEARLLKKENVDLVRGSVYVVESKGHKDRVVAVADDLLQIMRSYSTLISEIYPDSDYFFPRYDGDGPYTKRYHNHIVWSAVSLEDGKKYHSNSKSYYTEVRALSDALCQKYGLSIIETPESLRGKRQYEKWRAEENNQPTWRTAIRQDVDDAIQQSLTWRQFLSVLERKGYEVRMGRKYPVLRPPGKERFVRFKTLGKRYTPEAIQTRILYPQFNRCFVENSPCVQYGRLHGGKPRRKLTGLRALYYRYLYELGALPRKPSRPSYAVRQDAYKLDQRIRQMEFLSKNRIDTLAQLETHRKALQTEIGQLQTKRKQLPKTDDVQSQHESVNTALKQLRQEERLCRKIAEHSLEVQQHLTEARRDRAAQQQREQERARDRRSNIDLTL